MELQTNDNAAHVQSIVSTPVLPFEPYYKDEHCTIYNANNKQVLPFLARFDLLLTDPPYGIERFQKGFGTTRFKGHGCETDGIKWDVKPTSYWFEEMLTLAEKAIIWGGNNFQLPASEYFLVWDKEQTVDNFASAELAFTNIKCPAKVYRYSIHKHNQTHKSHPTQKPVALMQWCLGFAPDAVTVLDPFMGSGTTLVAAKAEGRRAVGIEINEGYCEAAAKRLEQGVLF